MRIYAFPTAKSLRHVIFKPLLFLVSPLKKRARKTFLTVLAAASLVASLAVGIAPAQAGTVVQVMSLTFTVPANTPSAQVVLPVSLLGGTLNTVSSGAGGTLTIVWDSVRAPTTSVSVTALTGTNAAGLSNTYPNIGTPASYTVLISSWTGVLQEFG